MKLPQLEHLGNYKFRLKAPLLTPEITVPAGFVTDGASVPRLFWNIVPPYGRYLVAAIVHDYMYETAHNYKGYADAVFLLNMERAGVKKWKRIVMYYAVKLFGRGNY